MAQPVPPPPELLLRSGGGVEPDSRSILAGDAQAVLAPDPDPWALARWAAPGFVAQVTAVRRHLAPIRAAGLLVSSFGREAFHGAGIGPVPAVAASPVRVAYAIRWIELSIGVDLPAWPLWLESAGTH